MNLTNEQVTALKTIAGRHGKRVLVNRNQVGIGDAGVAAFDVVYTHGARKPWQLRDESARTIKDEMKAVLAN
jgi:hypothetical protein